MRPPMFLRELLKSVKAHRRHRQQRTDEMGAEILKRLQELLDLEKPKQVETFSTKGPRNENDPGRTYRGETGT
jgi:hypothetical protein